MTVREMLMSSSTGEVWIEESDGKSFKYNMKDVVTPTTSPGGEITDLNVGGKNLNLVQAVTNPEGGVELVADGENLNFVQSVTSPGEGTRITNMISLTQAQYDAIVAKDPATLYVIVEG